MGHEAENAAAAREGGAVAVTELDVPVGWKRKVPVFDWKLPVVDWKAPEFDGKVPVVDWKAPEFGRRRSQPANRAAAVKYYSNIDV